MSDMNLKERFLEEKSKMDRVFKNLSIVKQNETEKQFLEMAENYYKDSSYFYGKKDYVRAFEAIVISWAYIDAGIKVGFFSVSEDIRHIFTS
jgi:hypothetical protein